MIRQRLVEMGRASAGFGRLDADRELASMVRSAAGRPMTVVDSTAEIPAADQLGRVHLMGVGGAGHEWNRSHPVGPRLDRQWV